MAYDSGIYRIYNKITNKSYIGQSRFLERRRKDHFQYGDNKSYINRAIKKNPQNFTWVVLEYCDINELDEKEKYWIKYFNSYKDGYNCSIGGNSWKGENHPNAKLTEENVRQIITLLQQKTDYNTIIKKVPMATINDISAINYGRNWHQNNLSYPICPMPGLKKISDELIAQVLQDINNKKDKNEIIEQYGITIDQYQYILSKDSRRSKSRKNIFSEEEVNYYRKQHFEQDYSIIELYYSYCEKISPLTPASYGGFKSMINGKSYRQYKTYSLEEYKNKLKAKNQQKKLQIKEMRQQGKTIKEIAKICNCSERTIYRYLQKSWGED